MGDFLMKYKYSIIAGMISLFLGFIPLSFKQQNNIEFVIYSDTIQKANNIKTELINFYKQNCYASDFQTINRKITDNIGDFPYDAEYKDYLLIINEGTMEVKLIGYLYKSNSTPIIFKNYFTSSASSIPDATSISVATSSLSDQI